MSDGSCAKVELIDVGMEQLNEHSRTANIIRQRLVVDGTPTSSSTEFVDLCGIFLLYDITDGKSFTELSNIIGDLSHLISPDCEIFLIGCKADRREDRKVSYKDAEDMSLKIGFSLFETSAKSGSNCELALNEMLEKIYEKHEEAASYVCDATEEAEPIPRFNLPHIFCQIAKSGSNCELALNEMLEKIYEKHEEAASYVCDATEEAEPIPRFNLPHIFCQMWNCG
ncbi:Ras-related protein Rab-26 [Toxocara canis]|uniref:Ras-related protein Rab-26 n=1 Tax=Toxocara canis TaxID=6265 RepID=A0A0B2UUC8_TOXCA|nr:Ras-related protein Rab-26 [Toxocara canis]